MVDIINEIQEDMRQERLVGLVKKYGPYVGGVVAMVLLITGAYLGWTAYTTSRTARVSELYAKVIDTADAHHQAKDAHHQAKIDALTDIAAKNKGHYGVLALFKKATILRTASSQPLDATYGALQKADAPSYVKNYALFLALLDDTRTVSASAKQHGGTSAPDKAKDRATDDEVKAWDGLVQRWQDFERRAPAWAPVARLMQAQILMASNRIEQAKEQLQQLETSAGAPDDVGELAQAYLNVLRVGLPS